ncbi:hypothetical protein O23A_P4p0021 (plasmid) [Aeromonas salmonicida]|nr:hypothetical protein O23A_P4p0021 [Aeromonas salmonicida]
MTEGGELIKLMANAWQVSIYSGHTALPSIRYNNRCDKIGY